MEDVTWQSIDQGMKYLESQDNWVYKFSTGLEERDSHIPTKRLMHRDSIYYQNIYGNAIRFKIASARREGFKGVIQPVSDLTIFRIYQSGDLYKDGSSDLYPKDRFSLTPQLGWTVDEYFTNELIKIQKNPIQDKDFRRLVTVSDEREKVRVKYEDCEGSHTGHSVNKIFFNKLG